LCWFSRVFADVARVRGASKCTLCVRVRRVCIRSLCSHHTNVADVRATHQTVHARAERLKRIIACM
jgi:hypothetical protein